MESHKVHHCALCLLLKSIFVRCIHVVICSNASLFFSLPCSISCYYTFILNSLVFHFIFDGHWFCFQFGTFMNSAAVNVLVTLFQYIWIICHSKRYFAIVSDFDAKYFKEFQYIFLFRFHSVKCNIPLEILKIRTFNFPENHCYSSKFSVFSYPNWREITLSPCSVSILGSKTDSSISSLHFISAF